MKLHAHSPLGHTVTSHGPGFIAVDGHRHEHSLLLLPEGIDPAWGPQRFEDLAAHHLSPLADLGDAIVLLGTGSRQRFPAPALLRPLIEAGIGLEVMDTAAACRTYNLLVSEGRKVAAALIIER